MEQTVRQGWYAVTVLFLLNILSLMDRQLLTLMVEPIRRDLGLSDTAISLLQGLAFALFYTIAGIPLAVLADRYSRKKLILAGVVAWSVMTSMCGLAHNFVLLFLARLGVGLGEATLTPSAHSMISESFPRAQVPRALSFYSAAGLIGPGASLLAGGAIIAAATRFGEINLPLLGIVQPWQFTFIVVGLLGLPFALLAATLREPPRQAAAHEDDTLAAFWAHMKANGMAFVALIGGQSLISIAGYAVISWVPTIFIRTHGWSVGSVGMLLGIVMAVAGSTGTLLGAMLAEHWRRKGIEHALLLVMALSAALAAPAALLLAVDISWVALVGLGLFNFVNSLAIGPCVAGIQLITPSRLRAKASAVFVLAAALSSITLGPTLVALITDYVFADPLRVATSVAIAATVTAALGLLTICAGFGPFRRSLAAADQAHGATNPAAASAA